MKTPTLRGLDLLRRENPAALADLRDDAEAAAEFGTDDAAAQRLAAVLRHSYAAAPLGT